MKYETMRRDFTVAIVGALSALGVGSTLGAITTLATVAIIVSAPPAAAHPGPHGPELAATDTQSGHIYVLAVEGMSCPVGCVPKVEEALRSIEGVESVEVDFDNKKAIVRTSPGHSITQKACDGALGNSGYFIDGIEEVQATDSGA